ncbi:MAG: helicase-related protein, partial [Burkholderiaceae bacterium]
IDTVERVEILRDLRLGQFDVLVGINLLREGLDLPEVSLVAILDADKEGFLRSERSLIQTIGRAARNLNGQAILYADRHTNSMNRAIEETNRRRQRQADFNTLNGIVPVSVHKEIRELIDGVVRSGTESLDSSSVEALANSQATEPLSEKALAKEIVQLEKKMLEFARNLEFEKAAKARDELARLKQRAFGAGALRDQVEVPPSADALPMPSSGMRAA